MGYTVRSGSTITANVIWADSNNSPVPTESPTEWSSSDDTIVTVAPDANDSTICRVTSVGPLGTCQVVATTTTGGTQQDKPAGSRTIATQIDVHVIGAEPTTGTIYLQGTSTTPYMPPPPMPPTAGTLC